MGLADTMTRKGGSKGTLGGFRAVGVVFRFTCRGGHNTRILPVPCICSPPRYEPDDPSTSPTAPEEAQIRVVRVTGDGKRYLSGISEELSLNPEVSVPTENQSETAL